MEQQYTKPQQKNRRLILIFLAAGLLAVILCALGVYFYAAPAYAAARLAEAKDAGIFSSAEEAFTASLPQPGSLFGGAQVVTVTNVQCSPNNRDGSQPFLWYCRGELLYDRIPDGHTNSVTYPGGFVLQVQGGWVWMSEGSFPDLVADIMERYHLEGVK